MKPVCHIDFETRSFIDLKAFGVYRYATDSTTEILCMAYMFDGETEPRLWLPGDEFPMQLKNHIHNGGLLVAHNANFERVIWEHKHFFDWPVPTLEQWRCTAAMAAAAGLPRSLEGVSNELRLAKKDSAGRRVMLKLSKPKKGQFVGTPEDFEKLYAYCKQDVIVESQIYDSLDPLIPFELDVWQVDQKINDRGVFVNSDTLEKAVKILKSAERDCRKQIEQLTDGEVKSYTTVQQLLNWIQKQGVDLDSMDKKYLNTVDLSAFPEKVQRVIEARLDAGKASTKKFQKMLGQKCPDGRIKGLHIYHGAHTGRWSGQLVQTQNMIRSKPTEAMQIIELLNNPAMDFTETIKLFGGHPIVELSKISRAVLQAPTGRKFIAGDYDQVEARGVFWFAGDVAMCEEMASGSDFYIAEAAKIFNKPEKHVTKDERYIGKQSILGDGFGMGWERFQNQLAGYGVKISSELASKAINTYRSEHPLVPQLWYALERGVNEAMLYPGRRVDINEKISYVYEEPWLKCKLPSGRELKYFQPEMRMVETPWGEEKLQLTYMGYNIKKQWVRLSTYGGKLLENADQAFCRDLFAYALVKAEMQNLRPVLLVHDEMVCEVSMRTKLEELLEIMEEKPPWAEGFPLSVSGWEGSCFRKD